MKINLSFVGFLLMAITCILFSKNIFANDYLQHDGTSLEVMGETYPIIEMDFLDFIKSRIEMMQKNGQWQSLQNHVQKDAIRYRDRPKKVEGITRVRETKSWKFDPSIVLDHDVMTPDGKMIALAGTHVNPLIYAALSKALVFYDGDDADQVKWALDQDKKLKGNDKLILVNGSILSQEKLFKKPIYFDQAGRLTTRFGITHVPSVVVQDGMVLSITEVKL